MPIAFEAELFTFTNPDGTTLKVRGWGNQYHATFEALDGYTIIANSAGFFEYAKLATDKSLLVPTGVLVGAADPRSLNIPSHIRTSRASARSAARLARSSAPMTRWEQRRQLRNIPAHARLGPAPPTSHTVGNYVGLCLIIQFPDVAGTIAQADVDNFCNRSGYTGFGNNGSVHDYFFDVSGGLLHYTNVVTAYYTAQNNRAHYTNPSIPYGQRARELIQEALNDLVNTGFNFGQLSTDTGGFVYALNVFYSGPRVNNWAQGLWPHASSLTTPFAATPAISLSDYQITDMGTALTLATFCHENGHMLCDFPDLYDYGGESRGAGRYCLMSYSGNTTNPVQVSGYLKHSAGWTRQLTATGPGKTVSLDASANDFVVHARNDSEYFIIENRQQSGRDSSLPDAGLAIWHVDEHGNNSREEMTATRHYECSLEQADGRFDLEAGANSGDGQDLFASPDRSSFSEATTPSSKWWDATSSGLEISNISASGTTMTLTIGAASCVDHIALHRPGTGTIWILENKGGTFSPVYAQGDPGQGIGGYDLKSGADRTFAFDYDHSGNLDHIALYRPGTGTIWILKNSGGTFSPVYAQGDPGQGIGGYDLKSGADRAFAFDYDHSGKLDHIALYRPATGTFWILKNSSGTFSPVYAQGDPGQGIGGYDLKSGADRAFAFDYDHSGKLDHIALYRPGTGTFWILKNSGGKFSPVYAQGDPGQGIGGYDLKSGADRAFAFDYDHSGKLDHIALYRPGTGTFWILRNSGGSFSPVYAQGDPGQGIGGYDLKSGADRAFAFDYDHSGKLDHIALYRPGTGTIWILKNSGGSFSAVYAEGDPGQGIGGYDLKAGADRVIALCIQT